MLFFQLPYTLAFQRSPLSEDDIPEFLITLFLRGSLFYKLRVEVFDIGEYDEIEHIGIISHISREVRILFLPCFGCFSEDEHIQEICLVRIHELFPEFAERRQEVLPDGIGVNLVVYFCEFSFYIRPERFSLILGFFEPLEFFDDV